MPAAEAEECMRVAARLAARLPLDNAPVCEQIEFCCRLKLDAWPIETRLQRTPPRPIVDTQRLTPPQRAEKRNAARRLRRAELRMARNSCNSSLVSSGGAATASLDDYDVAVPDSGSETSSSSY